MISQDSKRRIPLSASNQRDYKSAYHQGDFRRYLITATIQIFQEILQRRFTYFDTVCELPSLAEEACQIHSDKVRRLLFMLFKIRCHTISQSV